MYLSAGQPAATTDINSGPVERIPMLKRRAAHPVLSSSNPALVTPDRGYPSTVAVIGAGTIGPDIAYFFKHTRPETELVLVDIVEEPLDAAEEHIEGLVEKGLRYDQLDPADKDAILDILYTTNYEAIAEADLVIEAVTEDLQIKRNAVETVESVVDPDCIITSNTSSIPAEQVFADADRPERTTITHFFAPAWRNPVVELTDWDAVRQPNLEYLYWVFGLLGKLPLIVEDEIGFMLDRVFVNWCNEAGKLLDRATAAQVDTIAEEFVAAGPFAVLNLTNGNPVHVEAATQLAEENAAYEPEHIFRSVDRWNTPDSSEEVEVSESLEALIRDRLLGVLFSQATDVVDRGIGTRADLNVGCEAALGFSDGPLELVTNLGTDEVGRVLHEYSDVQPDMPTPDRTIEEYLEFDRHLVFDTVGDVAVITVRRPHRGNILSIDVFAEIERALRGYTDDPDIEGVVLTGFGPEAFSSGWEIDSFLDVLGDVDRSREYARECSELFAYMEDLELPVVAAINGHVMGAGLELVLRCHGIVAVEDAFLQFPEVTLGILPGIGGLVLPYRRWPSVDDRRFTAMLRFAKRLPTTEAAEMGVVDRLAQDQAGLLEAGIARSRELEGRVTPLADQLASPVDIRPPAPAADPVSADGQPLSPAVDEIICEGITDAAAAGSLRSALEASYEAFAKVAATPAAREGTTAFVEHRQPDLRGPGYG